MLKISIHCVTDNDNIDWLEVQTNGITTSSTDITTNFVGDLGDVTNLPEVGSIDAANVAASR